jgi:TP53 regulating kinase-like protein
MDMEINGGEGLRLVSQGAEGRIYEGSFLGRKCIVKERFTKTYRHPALDERLTKERMRGELRGIIRSKSIGRSLLSLL